MARTLKDLSREIIDCRKCPRLVQHCATVARTRRRAYIDQTYWGRPVPGFGPARARIVIVGLAPGAHGANRTGRVFTGDASGDFLYPALFRAGLASQPQSTGRNDGLKLNNCYITAAVRCAPPDNKPTSEERVACSAHLARELTLLRNARVFLCLGRIAFDELRRVWTIRGAGFGHGVEFDWPAGRVVCSYHVSRQNTQTGRLTPEMFDAILRRVVDLAQA